jgi:hypothetical protein
MKSIEDRKVRWCEMQNPTTTGRKFVYLINYPMPNAPANPKFWPDHKQERIEWSWKRYLCFLDRVSKVDDDLVPFLGVGSGSEIYAEAFGCAVYRPEDHMPMAISLIHSAAEVAKIKVPRLEDSSLMLLFDIADVLCERAGKGALLGLPDIQSPMDIAAQIWDKTDFFAAMVEEPQAVKDLAAMTKELLTEFLDAWIGRYGTALFANCPDFYMPQGIALADDEIGNVNPDMFEEFFRDELNELSDRYGGIGIHCCANSEHQWENLSTVRNLKFLNLYQPQMVIDRAYQYFSPFAAHWHGALVNGVPGPLQHRLANEYPENARVVITHDAPDEDSAQRLAAQLAVEYPWE